MPDLTPEQIEEAVYRGILRAMPTISEWACAFRYVKTENMPGITERLVTKAIRTVDGIIGPHQAMERKIAAETPKKRGRPPKVAS